MSSAVESVEQEAVLRAKLSKGTSGHAIHATASALIRQLHSRRGRVVDVGCGTGSFREAVRDLFDSYAGVDAVRYDQFPRDAVFAQADLDATHWDVADASADATASIETIEHLENPRAFIRELVRITKPGGLVLITTPNQLSLLSLLCLAVKGQYVTFQKGPGMYPTHRTALLPIDLMRIAEECGLQKVQTHYTDSGRIPGTAWHWPAKWGIRGRWFSDNVLITAFKPIEALSIHPS